MRFADIVTLGLAALVQHKTRTLLTLLGVIIGTFMLVMSLALGEGVQDVVARRFSLGDRLRRIEVRPNTGNKKEDVPQEELVIPEKMSEQKRERIREALIRRWPRQFGGPKIRLDQQCVARLARIPHVRSVVPLTNEACDVHYNDQIEKSSSTGFSTASPEVHKWLVAGKIPAPGDPRGVLVHEYLAYLWGLVTSDDLNTLLGKEITLTYSLGSSGKPSDPSLAALVEILSSDGPNRTKLLDGLTHEQKILLLALRKKLPQAIGQLKLSADELAIIAKRLGKTLVPIPTDNRPAGDSRGDDIRYGRRPFVIRGVFRGPSKTERRRGRFGLFRNDADILLPTKTAQEIYLRTDNRRKHGFPLVTVVVDKEVNVQGVVDAIESLDLKSMSLIEILDRVQLHLSLVSYAMSTLAGVALIVSALGITNTMVMSVLERTREIGIMKAVGARDRQILLMFLVEGALLGVIGGAVGLLASYAASYPADSIVQSLMDGKTRIPFRDSIFAFPLWLSLATPALSGLITTVACISPARRAARISPLNALNSI